MNPRQRAWVAGLAVTCFLLGVVVTAALFTMPRPSAPAVTCRASQPVYTGTAVTGSWHAVLLPGSSVTLPDGDTFTCTDRGAYVH